MKSIVTIFAFLFVSLISIGQETDYAKLDSFFHILEENNRFFGSVAVNQGGKTLYTKTLGYSDTENEIAINKDTKFRIGSISKTFTATLIMKAVELGKIDLDETIEAYFPKIENAENITIRTLLNHRSGIANFTDKNYLSWHTQPITRSALLDTIVQKGVDFDPNTDYVYSNSNYVLLTLLLEKIFDDSFSQILDTYIVNQIGLSNTGYGGPINTEKNEAKSYNMKTDWEPEPEADMSIPLGAGGIISTPTDLCLFVKALFEGKLISIESLGTMKPVGDDNYGFALYSTTFHEMTGWGHGGNIDAFSSNLIYFEEQDLCIALSCSGSNFGLHDVELAVLSEFFDKTYDLPSFEYIELTNDELDQYIGTYVTDDLPMDMIITKQNNTLYLEVTGQKPGPMQALGNHQFTIDKHGVKIKFVPDENKMLFDQKGYAFELVLKDSTSSIQHKNSDSSSNKVSSKSGDLDQYTGTYTSDLLPIDLTISKKDNQLIGQGEGQPSFTLQSVGGDVYSNSTIGLTITFVPDQKKMHFEQGGATFEMTYKD